MRIKSTSRRRQPLRAESKKRDNAVAMRTKMWDALAWQSVDVSQEALGDFEDSMFMGLEEIDGNAYIMKRDGSGVRAEPAAEAGEPAVATVADKGKKRKKLIDEDPSANKKSKCNSAASQDQELNRDEALIQIVNSVKKRKLWGTSSQSSVSLSSILATALQMLQFEEPTPIQSAAIPLSMNGGCDVIGAAETGSGKTLAFILPVVESLLSNWSTCHNMHTPHALIIAPTRELALQISSVLREISKSVVKAAANVTTAVKVGIEVVSIIGGMSEQKQRRQLSDKGKPLHIVVATPGRLCEILEDNTVTAFQDMSSLRFLIVDEADRMMEEGHFSELHRIFSRIADHEAIAQRGGLPVEEQKRRLLGSDVLDDSVTGYVKKPLEKELPNYDQIAAQRELDELIPVEVPEMPSEADLESARAAAGDAIYQPLDRDDDADDSLLDDDAASESQHGNELEINSRSEFIGQRQTLLYSATAIIKNVKNSQGRKGSKKRRSKLKGTLIGIKDQSALPDHLRELMALVGVQKKIHVVDVTAVKVKKHEDDKETSSALNHNDGDQFVKLPSKLKQVELHVPVDEKDLYAYYYITKNAERTLIFTNSIKTARRLDGLLRALGVNSRCLHAQMQQRQRLRALEAFASVPIGVLVATDVAARGLDVSNIQSVLHYDIARSPQVYVHRSGRTARAQQNGISISLVSPEDEHHHRIICEFVLGSSSSTNSNVQNGKAALPVLPVDLFSLPLLRQRVQAAKKIFVLSLSAAQGNSEQRWLQKSAEEADITVDEQVLREMNSADAVKGGSAGSKKELTRAKARLQALLNTPIPDSNNGLASYGVNALTASATQVRAMGMRPTKTKLKREANAEHSWKKRSSFFVYNPNL